MTREMRFRFIGAIFYLVFIANLLLTEEAQQFFGTALTAGRGTAALSPDVIIAALSFGAMLLTSDAIGYLFGTVFLVLWDVILGGWSWFWGNLRVQQRVLRDYKAHRGQVNTADKLEEELQGFVHDVFFCYFWHRAPKGLAVWASRRHLSFLINFSIIIGIITAYALSAAVVGVTALGTRWHFPLHVISLVVIVMLATNSCYSLRDMRQLVTLWFRGGFDKDLREAFEEIEKKLRVIEDVEE